MEKVKAAVMTGVNEPFDVRSYPLTPPAKGMAKIKMTASGICGTDIHIHRGKIPVRTPTIIGHELVGQVMDIAPEDSRQYAIAAGDHVIVDIACPCGTCLLCRTGDDANCVNMGVTNGGDPEVAPHLYGGYAEYNYSPVANLIKIPENLKARMTCVFACAGPTALHAFHLAEQANCPVKQAKVAVVQGLGPVGMFALIYLASLGIENIMVITARRNDAREQLALKLGATKVFSLEQTGPDQIISAIQAVSDGLGADLVYEASGHPQAFPQGLAFLRNRGVYLVPGQYSNSGDVPIAPQLITFKALHIIGSSQYSVSDVKNYLGFLQTIPQLHECIESLARTYTVEQINEAIEDAKAGKNIKSMLVPNKTS
ncbi:MAG: alcohol dehydrogenase catalytic domain-containing protein [Ruminococcaceae bacterium]|nr:alcohol dehydrogenase catalytic domain-containing protein [Oscillospiraceae bacterium]